MQIIAIRGMSIVTLLIIVALTTPAPTAAAGLDVAGRLTDPKGAPVAGATVELVPYPSQYETREGWWVGKRAAAVATTKSDQQGGFTVEAPKAGLWMVSARAAGRAEVTAVLVPLIRSRTLEPIELPPAAKLTVRVQNTAGEAIANALVVVQPERLPMRSMRGNRSAYVRSRAARTNENGQAELRVPAGRSFGVSVAAAGHAFRHLDEARGKVIDVTLEAAEPRAFVVRDVGGKPSPGAWIVRGDLSVPVAKADDQGRLDTVVAEASNVTAWSADGLRGSLDLAADTAAAPKDAPAANEVSSEGAGTEDPAGEDPAAEGAGADRRADAPSLIVLGPARTLVGAVVDAASGDAVPDALVYAGGTSYETTRTDNRGRFSLRLPADSRQVQSAKEGYRAASERIGDRQEVTLALEAAGRLWGRVVDPAGEPIAGAEVRSLGAATFTAAWSANRVVDRTDEAGRFELSPLGVEQLVMLEARHEGFAPAELEAKASTDPAADPLEIVMNPGRVALGQVTDAADQPLGGATVAIVPAPPSSQATQGYFRRLMGRQPTEAMTDSEGRFRIEDLPGGRFDLSAERRGFAKVRVPGVTISAEEPVTDLGTVIMLEGASLAGQVVDPDGQPLADAKVEVKDQGGGLAAMLELATAGAQEPDAVTGADGRFEVEDLQPQGTVSVAVERKGYRQASELSVKMPVEEPLRIVLSLGIDLHGMVIDEAGAPILGAFVQARPEGEAFGTQQQMDGSDAKGAFVLESLSPGRWNLTVSADGFQKVERPSLELVAGLKPEPVRITLARGATVAGVVTDGDGKPLGGVRVARAEQGSRRMFAFARTSTTSSADGRYRLEGLPPGQHVLSYAHEGFRETVRDVEVSEGEVQLDVVLEPGLEIAGRVVDAEGAPVAGARVEAATTVRDVMRRIMGGRQDGEETTADGTFRLRGLAAGSYTVSANKAGYAAAQSDGPIELATSSVEGIELRMGSGGTIVGTVHGVGFDDLASLQLFAVRTDGQRARQNLMGRVDHDGKFRIENVAAGPWMVYASLGDQNFRTETATVPEGGGEVTVEIDFADGHALEGTLRLASAGPATGYQVTAQGLETGGFVQATSDAQGRYRFEGLETGRYKIVVRRSAGARRPLAERELDLRADEVFDIEMQETRLSGRVIDSEGLPVAGASLSLASTEDTNASILGSILGSGVRTREDGTFEVTQVSPGTYRLQVTHDDFATTTQTIQVDDLVSVDGVEVVLERAAGLQLMPLLPTGEPARSVSVAVLDHAGMLVDSGNYIVGETGVARLTRVGAGTFTLLVRGGATATTEIAATVPGPRVQVNLQRAGDLNVRIPAASDGGKHVLTVLRNGRPERVLGSFGQFQEHWDIYSDETTVSPLAPGPVTLRVLFPDGTEHTAQAVVVAGQRVDVEVR